MRYHRIESESDLDKSNRQLLRTLSSAAGTARKQLLGYRPDQIEVKSRWVNRHKFWFAARWNKDHLWIPFGTSELDPKKILDITIEINTPRTMNHGRAGLFLRDGSGLVYLAHTGRVGGGKPNINKKEFLAYYRSKGGHLTEYADGKAAIVLGRIDKPSLVPKIAKFIRLVEGFKNADHSAPAFDLPPQSTKAFKPKFIGKVSYKTKGHVNAELTHDLVATELHRRLHNYDCFYTTHNDILIKDTRGAVAVLFEIKTDCHSTSIYTGIGQLLLNGNAENKIPRLVLVVPGTPGAATRKALTRLGIKVLTYTWLHKKPQLPSQLPRFVYP